MRNIKFRAWVHEENKFYYFTLQEILERRMHYHGSFDEKILKGKKTQYTECKDINGKEIYEGDIVVPIWWVDCMEELATELESGEVIFDKHEGCFSIKGHEPNTLGTFSQLKIIGNVYESIK